MARSTKDSNRCGIVKNELAKESEAAVDMQVPHGDDSSREPEHDPQNRIVNEVDN